MPFPLNSRVTHTELGPGVVKKYDGDKVQVLFDEGGRKTLSLGFLLEHGLLQLAAENAPAKRAPARRARPKKTA